VGQYLRRACNQRLDPDEGAVASEIGYSTFVSTNTRSTAIVTIYLLASQAEVWIHKAGIMDRPILDPYGMRWSTVVVD
jgi:hypothetical protein